MVVPVEIDGVTMNIETETAKATTTVKDDTGAVTRSTETETEKQITVVPVGMMECRLMSSPKRRKRPRLLRMTPRL